MKRWMLVLVVASLLIGACASARLRATTPVAGGIVGAPMGQTALEAGNAPAPALLPEQPGAAADKSAAPAGGSASAADRVVLKTASRTLVVNDPVKTADQITQMALAMGGFVVSTNIYQTSYAELDHPVNQGNITVRLPSAQLDEALRQIEALAVEVRSRNQTGQDVTAEYTDLQSRLRNLQAAEAQLREIMASATKTEDVMAVFNQLTQVRSDIEVLQGQIRYYEESATFAAVSIDLMPFVPTQPLQIGGWHPTGTARQALQALIRGLQTLADLLIYVVICGLPLVLIVGLPIFLAVRAVRARVRKAKAKPAA